MRRISRNNTRNSIESIVSIHENGRRFPAIIDHIREQYFTREDNCITNKSRSPSCRSNSITRNLHTRNRCIVSYDYTSSQYPVSKTISRFESNLVGIISISDNVISCLNLGGLYWGISIRTTSWESETELMDIVIRGVKSPNINFSWMNDCIKNRRSSIRISDGNGVLFCI